MAAAGGTWVKGAFKPAGTVQALGTGGGYQFSPAAEVRLKSAEDAWYKLDHEMAMGVDPIVGDTILAKEGGAHSVEFTGYDVVALQGAVLTHNHPSGVSFSVDDLVFASNCNLTEIRATGVGFDGQRHLYRMRLGPSGEWPEPAQIVKEVTFRGAEVQASIWEQINAGNLTYNTAIQEHYDSLARIVADRLGLTYIHEVLPQENR